MPADVIITGGGIAGLTAARELLIAGASVEIIEAADSLGGQVSSQIVGDVALDAAAESFALRDAAVADLIAELGRADDIVYPQNSPAWLIHDDGSAAPLPATGLLGVPTDLTAASVIEALGPEGTARAALDRDLLPRIGTDATSFGALVRARMGDAVVTELVAPITRGVHSKEPDALSVEAAHPRLRELLAEHGSLMAAIRHIRANAPAGSNVASLRGGMHTLAASLEADVRSRGGVIRTGTRARIIDAHSVIADGTTLSGTVIRAHGAPRTPLRTIRLATVLVDGTGLVPPTRGSGALVAAGAPGIAARALTHVSSKWAWASDLLAGREAIRLSYDAHVTNPAAHAVADASRILGVQITPVSEINVVSWQRAGLFPVDDGIPAVGESVAGTGLSSVIGHARRIAAQVAAPNREEVSA